LTVPLTRTVSSCVRPGDIGSDDEDGVLSDVVTAEGQRVRCDDRGDLTGKLNLLSDPPLQALLGGAPLALFS
jgi:hypothetical protein